MTEHTRNLARRTFLRGGIAAGGAALAAGAARAGGDPAIVDINETPWTQFMGEGVDARPYGSPSPHEAHVVRRNVAWLTADPVSSVNFTPLHELDGYITPNGLCFERHHGGIAEVEPEKWRLMINGLVERPLVFTLADLNRFP
ncbi:MAG: molybdopterin-dependent oxidoreductase, partial [Pseudomonadota bacterium]